MQDYYDIPVIGDATEYPPPYAVFKAYRRTPFVWECDEKEEEKKYDFGIVLGYLKHERGIKVFWLTSNVTEDIGLNAFQYFCEVIA